MGFADRFKTLRAASGLSLAELGQKLGLSKSAIAGYERGEREPDYETLQKIADFFGVDANYLLGYDASGYYTNPETAKAAQEIFDNKELRALFDAARGSSPESLQAAANVILALKEAEGRKSSL